MAIFLARILTVPILHRELCFFNFTEAKTIFACSLESLSNWVNCSILYSVYLYTGLLHFQAESCGCWCQSSCFSLTKLQSDWKTIIIHRTCCAFLRNTIIGVYMHLRKTLEIFKTTTNSTDCITYMLFAWCEQYDLLS